MPGHEDENAEALSLLRIAAAGDNRRRLAQAIPGHKIIGDLHNTLIVPRFKLNMRTFVRL